MAEWGGIAGHFPDPTWDGMGPFIGSISGTEQDGTDLNGTARDKGHIY